MQFKVTTGFMSFKGSPTCRYSNFSLRTTWATYGKSTPQSNSFLKGFWPECGVSSNIFCVPMPWATEFCVLGSCNETIGTILWLWCNWHAYRRHAGGSIGTSNQPRAWNSSMGIPAKRFYRSTALSNCKFIIYAFTHAPGFFCRKSTADKSFSAFRIVIDWQDDVATPRVFNLK